MNLSISAPALATYQRGFNEAPAVTQRLLLETMAQAVALAEREAKERMPRGATGLTAASITGDAFSTATGVLGVVGSSQPAALFVEDGTKPHMPPIGPLVPWVQAVLGVSAKEAPGVAFLVARKIARSGTKAQKPMERALDAIAGQVGRMFENTAARLAAQLEGGAA